ncbi:MAG TPA: ElyC/SanA/YdcF family protein [Candidatus Obscuribacterales bacterium]
MALNLLTRILVWAAVGLFLWYVLKRIIPKSFLTVFGTGVLLTLLFASFAFPTDDTISTIWRIISFPITPLGAVITILVLSFREVSYKDGFKKTSGQYVAIALTILLISSMPLFARFFVNRAEQSVEAAYNIQRGICQDVCPVDVPASAPLGSVVAMVIMGENMDRDSPVEFTSRVESTDGLSSVSAISPILASRLDSAGRLYGRIQQSGAAPFIMVTTGPVVGSSEDRSQKEVILREALAARGLPTGEGFLEVNNNGMDAHATMRDLREILSDRGQLNGPDTLQINANRVALVAPAIAMRRAALTFEEGDLQVVAWPTNLYGTPVDTEDTLALLSDLVPNVEALRLTSAYWNEVLTSFYYFLRGWLPSFNVRWEEIVELVPD